MDNGYVEQHESVRPPQWVSRGYVRAPTQHPALSTVSFIVCGVRLVEVLMQRMLLALLTLVALC